MTQSPALKAFGKSVSRLDIAVEREQGQLCTVCHVKPRAAGGKLSRCLDCLRADVDKERQQREVRKAKARQKTPAPTKACRTCKVTKPLAGFGAHRRARDGHRKDCKACVAAKRTNHPRRRPNLPKLKKESTCTNESV
jgi:hypothetical protein